MSAARHPNGLFAITELACEDAPAERTRDVACVITFFNQAHYLEACVDSVLAQTRVPGEILLIDDYSDPSHSRAARALCDRCAISYFRPRRNLGVSRARNLGAARTSARSLLFLDGDDLLSETYIEKLDGALRVHPESSFAFGVQHFFGCSPGDTGKRWPVAAIADRGCFLEPCLPGSGVLFRRAGFEKLGGFCPRLASRFEDWDLALTFLEHGARGVCVRNAAYHYRRHPQARMDLIDARTRAGVDIALWTRHRAGIAQHVGELDFLGNRAFAQLASSIRFGNFRELGRLLRCAVALSGPLGTASMPLFAVLFLRWLRRQSQRRERPR